MHACRSVTAAELGVAHGLGAAQRMNYMGQLNQFIAKTLLPTANSKHRNLQSMATAIRANASASSDLHRGHMHQHTDIYSNGPKRAFQTKRLLLTTSQEGDQLQIPSGVRDPRALLQDKTESEDQQDTDELQNDEDHEQTLEQQADSDVRLADEIGELYMYTARDLRAIAPLWWDYSKQVRNFQDHAEVTYSDLADTMLQWWSLCIQTDLHYHFMQSSGQCCVHAFAVHITSSGSADAHPCTVSKAAFSCFFLYGHDRSLMGA